MASRELQTDPGSDRTVLSLLGAPRPVLDGDEAYLRLPVTALVRDSEHQVHAGAMVAMAEEAAKVIAKSELGPGTLRTIEISLHHTAAEASGELTARSRVLSANSGLVALRSEIFGLDGQGRDILCATSSILLGHTSQLDARADSEEEEVTEGEMVEDEWEALEDVTDAVGLVSVKELIAAIAISPGVVERQCLGEDLVLATPDNAALWASLAAMAAQSLVPRHRSVLDLDLKQFATAIRGPIRTQSEVLRSLEESTTVDVTIYDAGAYRSLVGTATVTLARQDFAGPSAGAVVAP